MEDQIVYTAVPKPKSITVAALIRQLAKLDESLIVMVDTEARCDEYHLYPVSDVSECPDGTSLDGKLACIFLHI